MVTYLAIGILSALTVLGLLAIIIGSALRDSDCAANAQALDAEHVEPVLQSFRTPAAKWFDRTPHDQRPAA